MEFLGYSREDGKFGIRNYIAIIYTTVCSLVVAQRIQSLFPAGTQLFGYPDGCKFNQDFFNKIVMLGKHSSFAGVLVVGLGCEGTDAEMVAEEIGKSGKPVEAIKIQEEGGDLKTIEKGSRILMRLIQHASTIKRVKMTIRDLIIGGKCGGSDTTSGLASNPLAGVAADLIIDKGGTYMHTEVAELIGCSNILEKRAVNKKVASEIKKAIREVEKKCFKSGSFYLSYGNMMGGLTSIEEKSYGALSKSGTKPLEGVLTDFRYPPGKGYYILVSNVSARTFLADPDDISQLAACGAHLCLFTTGCGSTTGALIPVIKIMANPTKIQLIKDNVDFDATPIIEGKKTIEALGTELYQEIIAVAGGKLTKSEIYMHHEA